MLDPYTIATRDVLSFVGEARITTGEANSNRQLQPFQRVCDLSVKA